MKINYQSLGIYAYIIGLSISIFLFIKFGGEDIQPREIVEYSMILDDNGFSLSDNKNVEEAESISFNGNIKVKTINHQGRKYDVFYSNTNERFQVIRVPK